MRLRTLAIPVALYVFVTLGCPVVDGQCGARYFEHALTVVACCAIVCALVFTLGSPRERQM